MNSEELKKALIDHGSKFVYDNFLLNEDVHIFRQDDRETYHQFKITVSEQLGVPLKNIAIVGSAKCGYSLTPGKNYSAFHDKSDLDLVIVSPDRFKSLWESYLSYVNSSTGRSYNVVAKNIFKHFVSIKTENIVGDELKYFQDWVTLVDQLKLQLQLKYKLALEINYRVYDDWVYVERYHIAGLNELKVKV